MTDEWVYSSEPGRLEDLNNLLALLDSPWREQNLPLLSQDEDGQPPEHRSSPPHPGA